MRLVDSISVIVAQLLDNLLDLVIVLVEAELPDDTLETVQVNSCYVEHVPACDLLESSDLSLIVELVVQGALDAYIHDGF